MKICTHFSRKGMMIDLVFRSSVIIQTIVKVNLFELVSVGQRASTDVDLMLAVLFDPEHEGLTSVLKNTTDLFRKVSNGIKS